MAAGVYLISSHTSVAGYGRVELNGMDGDDRLIADTSGPATLVGGDGNDYLRGTPENDHLEGDDRWQDPSNPEDFEGDGDDTLLGLDGNDRLTPGLGDDLVDGGPGKDVVDFYGSLGTTHSVNVDLSAGGSTGIGSDLLSNLEDIWGRSSPTYSG